MVATELHTQCSRLSQDKQMILITVMLMTASAKKKNDFQSYSLDTLLMILASYTANQLRKNVIFSIFKSRFVICLSKQRDAGELSFRKIVYSHGVHIFPKCFSFVIFCNSLAFVHIHSRYKMHIMQS